MDAVNRDVPELAPKDKNVNFSPARASGVIKLCAEKAGWGKSLPKGSGLGLAWCYSHAGHVAQAVELSVDANKRIKVHRIVVVLDVGPIIDMAGVRSPGAGRFNRRLFHRDGAARSTSRMAVSRQQNYNDYPTLRMPFAPMADRGLFHPVGFSTHRHGRTRLSGVRARARQRHLRRHWRAGTPLPLRNLGYSLAV